MLAWEAIISTFAKKIEQRNYIGEDSFPMDYIRNFAEWNTKTDTVEIPADVATVKYFYVVGRDQIDLYSEHVDKVDPAAEARKIADDEKNRAIKRIREISSGHYQLRLDFVRDFSNCKKNMWAVSIIAGIALMYDEISYNDGIDRDAVKHLIGVDIGNKMDFAQLLSEIKASDIFTTHPEHVILSLAYAAVDKNERYWESRWDPNQCCSRLVHRKNLMSARLSDVRRRA
jgi:hypothetical protein